MAFFTTFFAAFFAALAPDFLTAATFLAAPFFAALADDATFFDAAATTFFASPTALLAAAFTSATALAAGFAAGAAAPFVTNAVVMALAALLLSRLVLPHAAPDAGSGQRRLRSEIVEGIRWLWAHRPVRTLALTIVSFNVTYGAVWSVLVLYATERLGMGEVGFGLLTTATALGGILGVGIYSRLTARVSLANVMRGGLVIETLSHLALALTTAAPKA